MLNNTLISPYINIRTCSPHRLTKSCLWAHYWGDRNKFNKIILERKILKFNFLQLFYPKQFWLTWQFIWQSNDSLLNIPGGKKKSSYYFGPRENLKKVLGLEPPTILIRLWLVWIINIAFESYYHIVFCNVFAFKCIVKESCIKCFFAWYIYLCFYVYFILGNIESKSSNNNKNITSK